MHVDKRSSSPLRKTHVPYYFEIYAKMTKLSPGQNQTDTQCMHTRTDAYTHKRTHIHRTNMCNNFVSLTASGLNKKTQNLSFKIYTCHKTFLIRCSFRESNSAILYLPCQWKPIFKGKETALKEQFFSTRSKCFPLRVTTVL